MKPETVPYDSVKMLPISNLKSNIQITKYVHIVGIELVLQQAIDRNCLDVGDSLYILLEIIFVRYRYF